MVYSTFNQLKPNDQKQFMAKMLGDIEYVLKNRYGTTLKDVLAKVSG